MELRKLLNDDNAVSPVIGVILMVAITVILAAVIATFVLGLGEQVSQTAPSVSFTFDYDEGAATTSSSETDSYNRAFDDTSSPGSGDLDSEGDGLLTITHAGGATINAERLSVLGASPDSDYGDFTATINSNSAFAAGDDVTAGSSLDIWVQSGDTIRIIWTSQDGQDSATLSEYEVIE